MQKKVLTDKKTGQVATYRWGAPIKRKFFTNDDIVDYYEKDVVKKIGEKDDEFVIEKKLTEFDRKNRKDYIESFKNECGVKNQIAKAVRNGESLDFVLNDKFKSPQRGFVDSIAVEDALNDPDGFAQKIEKSLKRLPKDLREKKSAREISQMSNDDIKKYVDEAVSSYLKARESRKVVTQPKGDENNG